MDHPPEPTVHPPERPLTPPVTPDRQTVDRTISIPPNLATEKQHKLWQEAEKFNASLLTPQSLPRRSGKSGQPAPHSHNPSPERQQQQQQQPQISPPQQVSPPSPSDELQSRRFERQKAMMLSPSLIADRERRRVIREREMAARAARFEALTRGILDFDDPLWVSNLRRSQRVRAASTAGAVAATGTTYVPPPNFGHAPGEGGLARREWEAFLRRREEAWGDPEAWTDGDVEGGEGGGEVDYGIGIQRRVTD